MNIALFGGGFDPPHKGHEQVTAEILAKKIVDEVWYVPVKNHPFGKQVTADAHRLAMLECILQPQTRIETYELDKNEMSYSYDTLEHLTKKFPQHSFSWIIGSDNLPTFYKWTDIHPMLLKYPFYVYPRKNFPMQPLFKGMIPLHDVQEVAVSSTEIREKVQQGESISKLVNRNVERYIRENALYLS